MSKKLPTKDEALEALDFIVNVLRQHEIELDKLVNELHTITEKLQGSDDSDGKISQMEEKLVKLQEEISTLVKTVVPSQLSLKEPVQIDSTTRPSIASFQGPPVILRCKNWVDFKNLACHAQNLSFLCKSDENTFQVDALKNNQIITYNGSFPSAPFLLKAWLSTQLSIAENCILEGVLVIG